jgi:hypothetical protein
MKICFYIPHTFRKVTRKVKNVTPCIENGKQDGYNGVVFVGKDTYDVWSRDGKIDWVLI